MITRALRRNRDLLLFSVPSVLLVLDAFGLTLFAMRPGPPCEIVMSTGVAHGAYHPSRGHAKRMKTCLLGDDVPL